MQKLIILLLVVCLVSVHAFVKRDAPASETPETENYGAIAKKFIDENIQKIKDNVNPETIKKGFNDFVKSASDTLEALMPTTTQAPKA